jgi:hypothetical protein
MMVNPDFQGDIGVFRCGVFIKSARFVKVNLTFAQCGPLLKIEGRTEVSRAVVAGA